MATEPHDPYSLHSIAIFPQFSDKPMYAGNIEILDFSVTPSKSIDQRPVWVHNLHSIWLHYIYIYIYMWVNYNISLTWIKATPLVSDTQPRPCESQEATGSGSREATSSNPGWKWAKSQQQNNQNNKKNFRFWIAPKTSLGLPNVPSTLLVASLLSLLGISR